MTPRARATAALVLVMLAAQNVAGQETDKEKPGTPAADVKPTTATVRFARIKASDDGKFGQVCLTAEGGGEAVPKVVLTMDNVTLQPRSSAGRGSGGGAGCPTPWDYRVELVPGWHLFEAAVYAPGSETPGATARDSLLGPPDTTTSTTTLHILAIGINRYPAGVDSLSYARSDARAFVDSLRRQSEALFARVIIDSLYVGPNEATKDSILSRFIDIKTRVQPNDTFVFYFAGHGAVANGHLFLAAAEVNSLSDPRNLTLKGLKDGELIGMVEDLGARSNLLVLDACRTGQMIQAFATKEARDLRYLRSPLNIAVLAATDSAGLAMESNSLRSGLFTAALIRSPGPGPGRTVLQVQQLFTAAENYLKNWGIDEAKTVQPIAIRHPPTEFKLVIR